MKMRFRLALTAFCIVSISTTVFAAPHKTRKHDSYKRVPGDGRVPHYTHGKPSKDYATFMIKPVPKEVQQKQMAQIRQAMSQWRTKKKYADTYFLEGPADIIAFLNSKKRNGGKGDPLEPAGDIQLVVKTIPPKLDKKRTLAGKLDKERTKAAKLDKAITQAATEMLTEAGFNVVVALEEKGNQKVTITAKYYYKEHDKHCHVNGQIDFAGKQPKSNSNFHGISFGTPGRDMGSYRLSGSRGTPQVAFANSDFYSKMAEVMAESTDTKRTVQAILNSAWNSGQNGQNLFNFISKTAKTGSIGDRNPNQGTHFKLKGIAHLGPVAAEYLQQELKQPHDELYYANIQSLLVFFDITPNRPLILEEDQRVIDILAGPNRADADVMNALEEIHNPEFWKRITETSRSKRFREADLRELKRRAKGRISVLLKEEGSRNGDAARY